MEIQKLYLKCCLIICPKSTTAYLTSLPGKHSIKLNNAQTVVRPPHNYYPTSTIYELKGFRELHLKNRCFFLCQAEEIKVKTIIHWKTARIKLDNINWCKAPWTRSACHTEDAWWGSNITHYFIIFSCNFTFSKLKHVFLQIEEQRGTSTIKHSGLTI